MSQYYAIVAMLIPVLTAAVTKSGASNQLRALLTAVFTVVAVVVHDGRDAIDPEALGNAVMTLAAAVGAYVGIWKHVDVNSKVLPKVGIGPVEAG